MKKSECLALLAPIVADYRKRDYAFWLPHLESGDPIVSYPVAENGTKCCVEICVHWDDQPNGEIRVMFGIDDGGLRSLMPVCKDFIIAPDGEIFGD